MINRFGIMLSHAGAALLFATVSAQAATVTYNDVTSWLSATTGDTNISFTATAGSFNDYSTSTGLVMSGVHFIGYISPTSYQLTTVDQMFAAPYFDFGTGGSLRGPMYDRAANATFLPYIHVTLPSNVTAFATNLMTASPNAVPFKVTLADGESFSVATGNRPTTAFFGLTADAAISYVDFALPTAANNAGTSGLLKNFQFGTSGATPPPADTPEAATLILIGTGLVFFRSFRKYMRPVEIACA